MGKNDTYKRETMKVNSNILIYQTKDSQIKIQIRLEEHRDSRFSIEGHTWIN